MPTQRLSRVVGGARRVVLRAWRRRRPRKLAAALGIVLVTLAALYLIGVNVLLSGGRLPRLVGKMPEKLRLEYASASSFWPGRFHVEDFTLRGRDAALEWELHIDSADVTIALPALIARRFHATRVRATGIEFRARLRLQKEAATSDRVARDPVIDGFDTLPLVDPEPEAPPARRPFSVELEDVAGQDVREVWFDGFRLVGLMRVRGGFGLVPKETLEVTPSVLTVHEATLSTGDDAIATHIEGAVDVQIGPAALAKATGALLLRDLTTRAALHGEVAGIRFLRHVIPGIDLTGGSGTFDGDLTIEKGLVKKGSRSRVDLGPATVSRSGFAVEACSTIDVTSADDDGGGWGSADVTLTSLALTSPTPSAALKSPRIVVHAGVLGTDLAELPRDIAYAWQTERVDLPDVRLVDAVIPPKSPFHIDGGTARISSKGKGTTHSLTTEATIESRMAMRFLDAPLSSRVNARLALTADLDAGTVDLSETSLDLTDLAVSGAKPFVGWWGKAKLEHGGVVVEPPRFDAKISVSARDARPFLSFFTALPRVSFAVRAAVGVVPDPLVETITAGLHGGASLGAARGSLDVVGLNLKGASSGLQGDVHVRGERKTGALLLEAVPVRLGIAFEGDGTRLVLLDAARWFESRNLVR